MSIDLARPHTYLTPARKAEPEPHNRLRKIGHGITVFADGEEYPPVIVQIVAMLTNVATDTIYGLVLKGEYLQEDKQQATVILAKASWVCSKADHNGPFWQDLKDAVMKLGAKS